MRLEINWTNILVLALGVFAVTMVIKMHDNITIFLAGIGDIGPNHPLDEQMWGLAAFGLVAVTLLGIIKILTRNKK